MDRLNLVRRRPLTRCASSAGRVPAAGGLRDGSRTCAVPSSIIFWARTLICSGVSERLPIFGPLATAAALVGLGTERRLVVILGGEGKGQDFAPLAAPVACHARAVVLIGRDAPLIRAALQDTGVALLDAQTLEQAVPMAAQQAHAGDAVLLNAAAAFVLAGESDLIAGAERAAAAEQGREQRRRFLTPGSGYQPGNARMFPNGN